MAGLGFDVHDGSGFKNKQGKQPTFAEAIAGNQTAQNLVNSPAASAVGTLAKGAAASQALTSPIMYRSAAQQTADDLRQAGIRFLHR